MDAIVRAKSGDLEFLKEAKLDNLLNARDSKDGDTVLSIVVNNNSLDCCKVICERCPSLLKQHTGRDGNTPLHLAAYNGYLGILKLLISTCDKEDQGGDTADKQKTLTLTNRNGSNAMHKAVHGCKTESIKLLIDADPKNELLKAGDRRNNTPLHLAVGLIPEIERYTLASLLIQADPKFSYFANSNGKTPLLMAIDKAESQNDREMLELILKLQPTQSMEKWNKKTGWTALHYSVYKKNLIATELIIKSCPQSSKEADNEGQNFFHHAVKFGNLNKVQNILGMKGIDITVWNSQDKVGRTPLDAAALNTLNKERITLCLLEDPRVDKKLAEAKHLQWVVEKRKLVMMKLLIEANPDFLKKIDSEVLQNSKDENGGTILFKAVQENDLLLCKDIYRSCPSLIYHQSNSKRTVMHNAAWTGEAKMLEFLINAAKSYEENEEDDIEYGGGEKMLQKLLKMEDKLSDTALHKAVLNQKLEAVRLLIDATEDFEYTTNASGETPLMIAVRKTQSKKHTKDSWKIRKLLFEKLPNQAKLGTGDKNWTLLHQAAFDGDINVIKDIIKSCQSCLELVDNEGKNFLHTAAEWGQVQVVNHVLGATQIADSILNHKDNEGNTPFHIAAQTRNEAMTQHFLYDRRIDKDTVNNIGKHVLHLINFSYDKRKAGVLGIIDTVDQSDLRDQSDFDLVVGALIATVSFTAGITVPGGYNSDGPNQGKAALSKEVSFAVFIISNTFALIFSLYAVFSHFCARRLNKDADIIYQLNVATLCTLAAMYCMMVAFIAGSFAVLANSNWLAIVVCIISCLFFVFACRPMWKLAKQRKRVLLLQVNTILRFLLHE